MTRLLILLLLFGLTAFPAQSVATPQVPTRILVDAGQVLAPVSPLLFGQNVGVSPDTRPQAMQLYHQIGVTLLRFPGGNYGDENDVFPNNLADLATLAKQLNAQVSVQVRSWRQGTPGQAAELVRYCNVEKKYNFTYWEVGNEPNYYATHPNQPGDPVFDQAWYNAQFRAYVTAMKAVDPTIKVFGPVVDQAGLNWLPQFIKADGDLIDGLSWHYYGHANNLTDAEALATAAYAETVVKAIRGWWKDPQANPLGFRRPVPPIFLSEYTISSSTSVSRQLGSQVAALWNAELLGRLANQGVQMGAHFALQGTGWQGLVDMLDEPRPVYGVYQLYTHWGNTQVAADSPDDLLPAFASLRKDGSLALLVINKDPQQVRPAELELQNIAPSGQVQVWALEQGQVSMSEKPGFPARTILRYNFPPYSITLLIVPTKRWSWLWFGGGVACALLFGAGIWFFQRRRRV